MQKLQGNLFKGDTAKCFKWPVEKRQFKKTQFRGVGKLWMCWMHAKLSPFVLKSAQELQKLNGAAPGHAQSNYFLPSSRRTLQIHHGIPFFLVLNFQISSEGLDATSGCIRLLLNIISSMLTRRQILNQWAFMLGFACSGGRPIFFKFFQVRNSFTRSSSTLLSLQRRQAAFAQLRHQDRDPCTQPLEPILFPRVTHPVFPASLSYFALSRLHRHTCICDEICHPDCGCFF